MALSIQCDSSMIMQNDSMNLLYTEIIMIDQIMGLLLFLYTTLINKVQNQTNKQLIQKTNKIESSCCIRRNELDLEAEIYESPGINHFLMSYVT